ncbi:putative zinc knuckle protein [Neofusicoccum parvum UCRNP2]|uniref:Putative zinc knuckle protein n=1 Tax=Botryosphaeria parva (strain UCR-NP2) TaxID=1287680 RepID=R1EUE6_BOTPV|nr:putative zinc knuckle protein [Neofusicoccum parvum UCRNP2]
MAPPNTPKVASSRLLTMKFMQRAAASQPSPKDAPSTPTGPPTKRQRTSAASSPATPSDRDAINAAIAAEELKRNQAIERAAAEAGETRWVLSFREPEKEARQRDALRVVSAGYAELDNEDESDDEEDETPQVGRMSFGKKPEPTAKDEDSESEEEESSESGEDDDPAAKMIREARREAARQKRNEKKKAKTEKMAQMAEERRKKTVKLNTLTSISGSGGLSGRSPNMSNMECFGCGKKGHAKKDCPEKNKRRRN